MTTNIVAILTDFGLRDIYVGTMKAVMLSVHADLRIVDLTHAIRPQNVREGAFALMNSYRYFPAETTFCVVVDPGVGSTRLPIAVASGDYNFVAPDNGVLSYALSDLAVPYNAVKLDDPHYHLPRVSHSFHGRDIFAPAAAYLAARPQAISDLGSSIDAIFSLPAPFLNYARQRLIGEVMHIDHFGNIVTSIGKFNWEGEKKLRLDPLWQADIPSSSFAAAATNITIHSQTIHGISHAYHEVPQGTVLAQIDSNGLLEIAANQDDAAARLDVQLGDKVMLKLVGLSD